jgi:hypothetical protein
VRKYTIYYLDIQDVCIVKGKNAVASLSSRSWTSSLARDHHFTIGSSETKLFCLILEHELLSETALVHTSRRNPISTCVLLLLRYVANGRTPQEGSEYLIVPS